MMRRLPRRDADALLRRVLAGRGLKAPAVPYTQLPGMPGMGDYGENTDEESYTEETVFRAIENPGQIAVDGSGVPVPDPYFNPIAFTLYPFSLANTSGNSGSVQLLSQNYRRQILIVQNLSSGSDLFVNFGSDAGINTGLLLTAGEGLILDDVCPNNSISVFFNAATFEPGIVVEGAPNT